MSTQGEAGGKRPWIRTVADDEATGKLAAHYDAAMRRAGRVFGILRIQSLKPDHISGSIGFYGTLMHGPSGLSRVERELLAVVVSATNRCHY